MSKTHSIDQVLKQKTLKSKQRDLLETAQTARKFATQTLALPDNKSYQKYTQLDRDFVTWIVVATDEFSMQPMQSCFPIIGCLSYRGYFSEAQAKAYAEALKKQGKEVHVNGSPAYSTLGWFSDPIVSPMLKHGELSMLETMFHELAHQRLYIKNDSDFNEAFASTVGHYGIRQWLAVYKPTKIQYYNSAIKRNNDFLTLLHNSADKLRTLYAERRPTTPPTATRKAKQIIIQQLQHNYLRFRQQHKQYKGYDKWFKKPINNPRLALISVYHDLVPEFSRWFHACDDDFERFYKTMETFAPLSKNRRHQRLNAKAECKAL